MSGYIGMSHNIILQIMIGKDDIGEVMRFINDLNQQNRFMIQIIFSHVIMLLVGKT